MSRVHKLVRPFYLCAKAAASFCAAPVDLALHTLGRVLRNSVLYVGVGWFFGFCFATGNICTGLPPSQQSYATFSAAVVAWFWGVFSVCMIVIMSAKLLREQFIGCSSTQVAARGPTMSLTRNVTLLQCIRKLAVPMTPHLVLAGLCAVGGDFLMYSIMPPNWSKFKPILYIGSFWGFYSMVIADSYARQIFQTETVRGIVANRLQTLSQKAPVLVGAGKRTNKLHPVDERRHSNRFWTPTPRRILQVYRKNLPVIVFALIAIVYVHALSQFIHLTGKWGMFACACASIALKLSLQELAKHIMMSVRRPVSRRVMVALISTPTILVDTQVRMLLLRQDNLNVSVAGTVLLAIFEIVVRALKSVVVQRKTRRPMTAQQRSRRRSSISTPLTPNHLVKSTPVVPVAGTKSMDGTKSETGTRPRVLSLMSCESPSEYKARRDVEERRRKLRVLHAGEIYAEMYAEYIAIGCSYAILFFYRDHHQFEFRVWSDLAATKEADGVLENKQLTSLGILQLSVEVVVDFLSCVLEASEGVEFKSFNQNDPFLVFFLAMLTFSNIAIFGRNINLPRSCSNTSKRLTLKFVESPITNRATYCHDRLLPWSRLHYGEQARRLSKLFVNYAITAVFESEGQAHKMQQDADPRTVVGLALIHGALIHDKLWCDRMTVEAAGRKLVQSPGPREQAATTSCDHIPTHKRSIVGQSVCPWIEVRAS